MKYIVIALFCIPASIVKGQNLELIQQLKGKLPLAETKARFDILNDLAWEYRWAFPDSTILYAQEAYDLGLKLRLDKDLAEVINFIGVAYNYKGDRLKAYEYYDQALQISTEQNDSLQIAYSNNNLGRLFFEQGILSKSYDYFIRALAIFDALRDASGLAYTYQSLANLYNSQKDLVKSEHNYLKAYKIRLTLGNTRDIMSALGQLGRFYQDSDAHEKALHYLHLADSAGKIIQDEIHLAEIKTLIAESYLHQNKLDEAEKICEAGLKVIKEVNNIRMMPQAYLTMGQIQFARNDYEAGKKYFEMALAIATKSLDLISRMDAHYWLWKTSEKQNNMAEKLKNQNVYLVLKDSVKDLDLARQVERFQFEIEIERKERENELLKVNDSRNTALIEKQKLQNIILIVIAVSGGLLIMIQWAASSRRKATHNKLAQQNNFIENQQFEIVSQNEKLSKRNEELSELNYEKDTLMSIVAHDLKSPLHRIKGIIAIMELEGGLTRDQHVYLEMIKKATGGGLDLIKDLLDVHMIQENTVPNFSCFDLSLFILEKTRAFEPSAEAKQIHLQIARVESEVVYMDQTYLGRIIDNILSNAIKFSSSHAIVKVGAGKTADHIWLSVKDEGQGFSDSDRLQLFQRFKKLSATPTAGETSNGLGLAIVKTLIDRLGGTIDLTSEIGKGSEFVIKLPLVQMPEEGKR